MKLRILLILTVGCWLWLWSMVKRPDKWAALVDKENAFCVIRGIAPALLTERIKRFEKGRGQRVLLPIAAVLCTVAVALHIVIEILQR